ncbi:hypothetical protein SOVF_204150 [Spinacia oleracea]|uniref:DUF761 domain-containing protein n=1 Tax=Spinacia oleracea TaxID=3562 RepID=A0A9R0IDA7_SPIOL|nr:uncharacterized protein LOC110786740 [Spinacia oleracea]KNA03965.1 hypothetical protein SOVF_204150 [Spinacia oleracea]
MKNKASVFVKNMISALSTIVKGKVTGVKGKANAMRVRLLVFSLMKGKKLSLGTLSTKIQALLDRKRNDKIMAEEEISLDDIDDEDDDQNKAIILYNTNMASESSTTTDHELAPSEKRELLLEYYGRDEYYDDDKYPDLTHSLFDEEDEHEGSIIDMVKNSKENEGQDFKLEDEIDHVADLFIKRFRRQMLLQKWDSFKRIQEMLGRSA